MCHCGPETEIFLPLKVTAILYNKELQRVRKAPPPSKQWLAPDTAAVTEEWLKVCTPLTYIWGARMSQKRSSLIWTAAIF